MKEGSIASSSLTLFYSFFYFVLFFRCVLSSFFFHLSVRSDVKQLQKDYDKTEDDLKAVQNAGQIIAEVLKRLDEERCKKTNKTTGETNR